MDIIDTLLIEFVEKYRSEVVKYITMEGTAPLRAPYSVYGPKYGITETTSKLRQMPIVSKKRINYSGLPDDRPLYSTGRLARSIVGGVTTGGIGVGEVNVSASDSEVARKAWFLHQGGYTSPRSAIPNKWVPPRPFMMFPYMYKSKEIKKRLKTIWIDIFDSLNLNQQV